MIPDSIRAGDRQRALWLSTFAFTICFAVWSIFAIIGIRIQKDLGLSDTQFGLLVGTPILMGSVIRLILGVWSDQYGARVQSYGRPSLGERADVVWGSYDDEQFLAQLVRGDDVVGLVGLRAGRQLRAHTDLIRALAELPGTLAS